MKPKKIAIIGGPSSGKSTLLRFLEQNNHCCYNEVSREVIKEAQKKGIEQLFLTEPLLFSEMLLEKRIQQYIAAQNEMQQYVFIDRGLPDVVAYLDYIGENYPENFINVCENYKYDAVFLLPIWKEIYVSDAERYENLEQAEAIEKHLITTYQKYNYHLIEVPKDTVENRAKFILETLQKQ